MAFEALPQHAAWTHRDSRQGFEVVFIERNGTGHTLRGHTTAVQEGEPWTVDYEIVIDDGWRTRTAQVWGRAPAGEHEVRLDGDGQGQWHVNGTHVPELDGCFDVDLESSSCTNTFPIHRLGLDSSQSAEAPAAYVRAINLEVGRLEQTYTRVDDDGAKPRFDYYAPAFDFRTTLVFDQSGLILDYPYIASRAGLSGSPDL